jgi:undecaprenyl-phosphate 4-deoxy-4-formamido-L-arabinose transferase
LREQAAVSDPQLSIVIPVHRSGQILPVLHDRLVRALSLRAVEFEIVFVEDGGGDRSWEVISGLVAADPRVSGLRLARNYGQHNALLAGIRCARGDVIVTMDDDLQHPPEEIHKLLAALTDDIDVVYGTPGRMRHGLFRNLAARVTKAVLRHAMGAETAGKVGPFRAFRTPLRSAFADYSGSMVNLDVLLTWGTARFTAVVVNHEPRAMGRSGYRLRSLLTHSLNMVTGFTTVPLQLASLLGLVVGGFGAVVLAYVVGRYVVSGTAVPGFPFLASIIAIFSGAQLFALGMIGEYLARVHQRTMGEPTYVISATARNPRATGSAT